MKRSNLYPALTALVIAALLLGCAPGQRADQFRSAPSAPVTSLSEDDPFSSPTPDQLTEAEAMDIALKHARLTAEQVQYLTSDFEVDNGIPHYDVEFSQGQTEYEYEIHAETGEILSMEQEV